MVTRFKNISMDNAKEFFFENKCNYQLMDWNLYDEFRSLNISKETIHKWINEYYHEKLEYFKTLNSKTSFFYDMQYNFSEIIDYDLLRRYYEVFFTNIKDELPEYEFAILSLIIKKIGNENLQDYEFKGVLKTAYLNRDNKLIEKAFEVYKFILNTPLDNSKMTEENRINFENILKDFEIWLSNK